MIFTTTFINIGSEEIEIMVGYTKTLLSELSLVFLLLLSVGAVGIVLYAIIRSFRGD